MHVLLILATEDDASGSASLIGLLPFLLIPVVVYLLMIRPQRRRMREQQAMQKELDVGDEIVTTSGMYGFVTGFDEGDRVWVEIDDDVQVRLARAAIQGKVDTAGSTSPAPPARQDAAESADAPADE